MRPLALTVLMLALTLVGGPQSASAAFPGANGPLVFVCGHRICAVEPDGSDLRVVADPGKAYAPSVGPDGHTLLYSQLGGGRSPKLVLADLYSPASTVLYYYAEYGSLSGPSGSRVVMQIDEANCGGRIFVGPASPGDRDPFDVSHQLIHNHTCQYDPAFSPRGDWIAYSGLNQILRVSDKGNHRKRLTDTKDGFNDAPSFSPDGKQIVFTRGVTRRHASAIFVMDTNGDHAHRVSDWMKAGAYEPSFSPDGQKIAFRNRRGAIQVMNRDGSGLHTVLRGHAAAGTDTLDWAAR